MGGKRRDLLTAFCCGHEIEALYSFGSRAEEILHWLDGDALLSGSAASDVDIGVKPVPERRLDMREKATMMVQLEDLFGVRRVDLVVLPEADPFLAANVMRGERLYVRDGRLADEYELYLLRRAGDLAPLERERLALIGRR
jgi:uncharacterized protein